MTNQQRWRGEEHGRLPKRGRIVNRNELAKLCDVVPSTINKWQELGMPVHRKGSRGIADQFDAADCLWWRVEYRMRVATANQGDELSLRKLSADVALKERDRDRRASQLIPIDMFIAALEAAYAGAREPLDSIAQEVAPLVATETDLAACHRIIERAVNDCRRRMVSPSSLSSLQKRLGL